jgi:predicted HTH domain antitoxin
MVISFEIPKHAEQVLKKAWGDRLDQAAFEGLAIESYRTGKLSAGELAELLGLASSIQAVRWLGARGVPINYSMEDLEADRRVLASDFPELRP